MAASGVGCWRRHWACGSWGSSRCSPPERSTSAPSATRVGGVRAALYDNALPLTPTALSLLALLDLQHAAAGLQAATAD